MSLIFTFYLWREWEDPGSESLLEFFKRKQDLAWVCQVFPFHPSFSRFSIPSKFFKWENFYKYEKLNFSLFFLTKTTFPSTWKLFLSSNSMRHTLSPRISKTHFHPNLMKNISDSNETCFFMILHENIIIWSHVHFFSVWSNFHRSHMILVVQPICQVCKFKHFLNSNSHEKRK